MADRIIDTADLRGIEERLSAVYRGLDTINGNVDYLNSKVGGVENDLAYLTKQFLEYTQTQQRATWLLAAKTDIVKVNQELESKYGHYKHVRRTSVGILQATDLEMVRGSTLQNVGESLMIDTPNYWLSPCVVALVAWIQDDQNLCKRALTEALKRNDEKTSLFFALVCRRANRKSSCMNWTNRYLSAQDEENLDANSIVILDAFTSGLLGKDSEGKVAAQIEKWLTSLSEKPGFVEEQIDRWSTAIKEKRKEYKGGNYTYLPQYSETWPVIQDIMSGAYLHTTIFDYFDNIFKQENSIDTVKAQLDKILETLVTDFDEEERPLRVDERLCQLIIELDGDKPKAQTIMQEEQKKFAMHKNFTQLLTDAAMSPETSHAQVSTQKFSIALSRDWIQDAYHDVMAENRMKIPNEVVFKVGEFKDKSIDGSDENELVTRHSQFVDDLRDKDLSKLEPTTIQRNQHFIGAGIAAVGLILCLTGSSFFGIALIIVGLSMFVTYFLSQNNRIKRAAEIRDRYASLKEENSKIIRAICAEIVDFREEFRVQDSQGEKVIDFLSTMETESFINNADSVRRVMI